MEVSERHNEEPYGLVDGTRTEDVAGVKAAEISRQHTRNNETMEPSTNIVKNPESARKKVVDRDSLDLADPRVEILSKVDVPSSSHEKLDHINGSKREGEIGEKPDNLFIGTKNNEDYRTDITRQKDSSMDTLNKVKESKQEITEGVETMKVDSTISNDEDGNEEYVFPAREVQKVAGGLVKPSTDLGKPSNQSETVEKPVRKSSERSLSGDSMTEWTREGSQGDGDFEDVSDLSLPDGTTGQSQAIENAAKEKLTDEGKEKRTAIESIHNTVPGSSVVAENVTSTSRHEMDSRDVISKEENHFVDRNNENTDNFTLEHNVQERDHLAEETDIHDLEGKKLPAITGDALISLLQIVDGDLEVSFSPETIYRSPACSSDMKEEIIK